MPLESTPSIPSPSLFSLDGQTVLITGATRGIGAACAIALAEAGASVCLVQRPTPAGGVPNLDTFNRLLALPNAWTSASTPSSTTTEPPELPQKVRVEILYCDLADLPSVKELFPRALELMGGEGIHVLVNCGGIQRREKAVDFAEGDWDDVLNTNLKSIFLLSQSAARHMLPLHRGSIINFCSLLTFQGGLTVPAYAAAKGGLGQLTKALSNEWSAEGVRVNAICPGYIETDMNERLLADPTRLRQISERIPAGRWGAPGDFAGPVVFLASKASTYVCGELLVVDGGWMGR